MTEPDEKKEALIDPDLKRLMEIADFSNMVEAINKNLKEYHEKIVSIRSGLNQLLEILPAVVDEADRVDTLQKQVLSLVKERLEKTKP